MLTIHDLKKSYQGFQLNLSMDIPDGQIVGLIGPNGSGKSTTMKAILQLIRPDSGAVELFGRKWGAEGSPFTKQEKQRLGVAMPDSGFSGYLTVKDVCGICAAMYADFEKQKFLEYCDRLELPLRKQIRDFSTGMKAKLKVMAALCHQADFLILDEPTAGLDVIVRDSILDILREYMEEREDRSILISSHISSDLEHLCDTLYMISRGAVVFHEDTDRLLSDYAVLKASEAQLETLDKNYLLRKKKEAYGYACLTAEKQFYKENYPELVIEHAGIDDVILLMEKGDALK